jgi:rare lipoprotein A (peptidoglycan hydrolase)
MNILIAALNLSLLLSSIPSGGEPLQEFEPLLPEARRQPLEDSLVNRIQQASRTLEASRSLEQRGLSVSTTLDQLTDYWTEMNLSDQETCGGNTLTALSSWYGPGFHGRRTANGEIFNQNDFTVAHKTLPFGTIVSVLRTDGAIVHIRVNDRGPYIGSREFDFSRAAASVIQVSGGGSLLNSGVGSVYICAITTP